MIVTDDEDVFEKASLLKFHGMDREAWKRFAKAGSPRYDVALPGFKYNMMDIQAALGLHQLDAPRRLHRRARRAWPPATTRRSRGLAGADPAAARRLSDPARLAPLHAARGHRPPDDLPRPLHGGAEEDATSAPACTTRRRTSSPTTRTRFGWKPEDFPEAHFVSERIVSLPLFPGLTDEDQDDVVAAVREVLEEFRR